MFEHLTKYICVNKRVKRITDAPQKRQWKIGNENDDEN